LAERAHVRAETRKCGARIVGPDGKIYAHATTTCLVFEVPSK
jgi:hypothetical protein